MIKGNSKNRKEIGGLDEPRNFRNSLSMSLDTLTDYVLTQNSVPSRDGGYKRNLAKKIGKATRISQPGNTVSAY